VEQIIFYRSERVLGNGGFLCFVMVILSIVCMITGFLLDNAYYIAAGIAGEIYFGLCTLYIVYSIMRPKAKLIIDDKGIIEKSSIGSIGTITWEEIDHIYMKTLLGKKYVCLKLTNEKSTFSRISVWKRYLSRINKLKGFEPVSIALHSLESGRSEVLHLLKEGLLAYQNHEII